MYWDLLAKIKNATRAKRQTMHVPYSKMDFAVAQALVKGGFIKEAQKKTSGRKNTLEIKLAYNDGKPALTDFKLVSKPSRHFYAGYRQLKSVKQGYGISVLSTPGGVVTGGEAKRTKVGGEYLFEVW